MLPGGFWAVSDVASGDGLTAGDASGEGGVGTAGDSVGSGPTGPSLAAGVAVAVTAPRDSPPASSETIVSHSPESSPE